MFKLSGDFLLFSVQIRECRSEKEEQLVVLQNILNQMNHNATMVDELESTIDLLTSTAATEDDTLKKQESQLVLLKDEVESFVCDCEYNDWEENWGICTKSCKDEG